MSAQAVQFGDRVPVCSEQDNAPSFNSLLKSYGVSSRCLTHGRDWVVGGSAISNSGGGCYQVRLTGLIKTAQLA